MSNVYQIHPLNDPRWAWLLLRHPSASVFHSEPWLRAIQKTYGFEPVVLTTSSPEEDLQNALLFCRIESPMTGRRLVSLPFSDHCAPLTTGKQDLALLMDGMRSELADRRLRYVELRPVEPLPEVGPCHTRWTYRWHRLDLTADISDVYSRFHRDCVARKIRRAEREHLVYRKGNSGQDFADFWKLYLLTRKRHGAPPQPLSWFRNLIGEFGEAATIHLALQADRRIAAIFTLEYKDTLVYKYGCSDPSLQALGGTHLLFWHAIQDAKARGLKTLDLGRSDYSNEGLIQFKDRWGACGCDLVYSRFTAQPDSRSGYHAGHDFRPSSLARRALTCLPDSLFAAAGALLYRHIA
jgi:hypothetical protein